MQLHGTLCALDGFCPVQISNGDEPHLDYDLCLLEVPIYRIMESTFIRG